MSNGGGGGGNAAGQVFGAFLTMYGTQKRIDAIKYEGRQALKRAYEQQTFNEIAATQMVAVGQRAALEENRQAELMASRAVAVAAAGGSVSDVTHLIADIYGEGAYRASVAMYEAETAAERLRFEGEQGVRLARDIKKAGKKKAKAARIEGFASMF